MGQAGAVVVILGLSRLKTKIAVGGQPWCCSVFQGPMQDVREAQVLGFSECNLTLHPN